MCPKPLLTQYDYTCLLSKKQDVTRKYFFDPAEKKAACPVEKKRRVWYNDVSLKMPAPGCDAQVLLKRCQQQNVGNPSIYKNIKYKKGDFLDS